jgi:hypothetical protein
MKLQSVTLYRVSHLQRYGVTVRGNATSVYPTLNCCLSYQVTYGRGAQIQAPGRSGNRVFAVTPNVCGLSEWN